MSIPQLALGDGGITNRKSRCQFWNRLAMVNNWRWPTIEVFDERLGVIDTKVVVNGCQKVSRITDAVDGIFTAFICGANDLTRFNAATRPDI
jgi:hypothetical protein